MVLGLPLILLTQVGAEAPQPDLVGFELLLSGRSASGFTIDSNETITSFDHGPERLHAEPEIAAGDQGNFAAAREHLSRYRPLADDGCDAKPADVLAFRLTWRESGVVHRVDFADSCKGIPTDLIDTLRPVAVIVEAHSKPSGTGAVPIEMR